MGCFPRCTYIRVGLSLVVSQEAIERISGNSDDNLTSTDRREDFCWYNYYESVNLHLCI